MDSRSGRLLRAALGHRIAFARRAKGWTQAALAEAIDIESCSLSRYECGVREPPLHVLVDIARVLDVPLVSLLAAPGTETSAEGGLTLVEDARAAGTDELFRAWVRLDAVQRTLVLSLARALAT